MASELTNNEQVCPICLESRNPMKILDHCKHVFCVGCLSSHLRGIHPDGGVIQCPVCKVENPIVGEGVDGIADFPRQPEAVRGATAASAAGTLAETLNEQKEMQEMCREKEHQCTGCKHRKKAWVQAKFLCVDCGKICFCSDCEEVHRKNKVTQFHHVIRLSEMAENTEVYCSSHDQVVNKYCCTCNEPVCPICILFDHEDHQFRDIRSLFDEVRCDVETGVKKQEERLNELTNQGKHLTALNESAYDRRDILLNEVENQSEKCIQGIVKHKEALKRKIRDWSNVEGLADRLAEIPVLTKALDESMRDSNEELSRKDSNPSRIKKLCSLRDTINEHGKRMDTIDWKSYWSKLEALFENTPEFVPKAIDFAFGTVTPQAANDGKHVKLEKYDEVYQHEYDVDEKMKFIPEIVCLEKLYAVARPMKADEEGDAMIDIFELPGTLKKTIQEHVQPPLKMARTPTGKLAVLTNGEANGSVRAREYDTQVGHVGSTQDFLLKGRPLSFAINQYYQYVILSDNEGQPVLTVFRRDGTPVQCHELQGNFKDIRSLRSIDCIRNAYVIIGENGIICFKIKEGKLVIIASNMSEIASSTTLKDVSTSRSWITFSYHDTSVGASLGRVDFSNKTLSKFSYKRKIVSPTLCVNTETSISESETGRFLVASQGHTFRVFSTNEINE